MVSEAERSIAWTMRIAGLPEPEVEFLFAKPRRWRFDFAWPDKKAALEVEGGSWVGGRHTSGAGFEADAEKYNEAALRGWRVYRVTPNMIKDGRALALMEKALA